MAYLNVKSWIILRYEYENRSPLFITSTVSGANLYSTKRLPSATSFNDDFRYGQLYETILKSHNNDITKTA